MEDKTRQTSPANHNNHAQKTKRRKRMCGFPNILFDGCCHRCRETRDIEHDTKEYVQKKFNNREAEARNIKNRTEKLCAHKVDMYPARATAK